MPALSDFIRAITFGLANEGSRQLGGFLDRRREKDLIQKAIEGVSQAPANAVETAPSGLTSEAPGLGSALQNILQRQRPLQFGDFPIETFQVPATSDFATGLVNAPAERQKDIFDEVLRTLGAGSEDAISQGRLGINAGQLTDVFSGQQNISLPQLQQEFANVAQQKATGKGTGEEPFKISAAERKKELKRTVGGGTINRGGKGGFSDSLRNTIIKEAKKSGKEQAVLLLRNIVIKQMEEDNQKDPNIPLPASEIRDIDVAVKGDKKFKSLSKKFELENRKERIRELQNKVPIDVSPDDQAIINKFGGQ